MHRIFQALPFVAVVGLSMFAFASRDEAEARPCTREYRPVCALARDGKRRTYPNACVARASKARILHAGECFGPICIMMYDPVCGRDAKGKRRTYPSLCAAENDNAAFLRKGPCR